MTIGILILIMQAANMLLSIVLTAVVVKAAFSGKALKAVVDALRSK